MNILRAGGKTPMQRDFFKNVASDLLPAQGFWAGRIIFVIM